ncbi:MAG: helix-turn-helix transcriptional regulator [Thermoleophilia bacterium]
MTTGATLQGSEQEIGRLTAALGDVTRRRVFFALRSAGAVQTKDDIANAVGIDRRLAGFHLDKLVEYGFATATLDRPTGASGPGRPAKRYAVAHESVLVARPERHYELLAALLLRATREGGGASQESLERVGYEYGLQTGLAEVAAGRERPSTDSLAHALEAVARLLTTMGFSADAEAGSGAGIALRACACPFEELAFDEPGRICGLDRAIWRGMIAAFAPEARVTIDNTRAGGDDSCLMIVEDDED